MAGRKTKIQQRLIEETIFTNKYRSEIEINILLNFN